MFALPSKLTPLIVLAVSRAVAVAAFPEVSCVPAILTPARFILAVPSKETPPIVRAVARAVAVSASAILMLDEPSKLVPPIVLAVSKYLLLLH